MPMDRQTQRWRLINSCHCSGIAVSSRLQVESETRSAGQHAISTYVFADRHH